MHNHVRFFVVLAIVAIIVLFASFASVTIVETGHRGVKIVFGQVIGDPLPEGIYFTSPFTTNIVQVDIRTEKLSDRTLVYTKDVQTATIDFAVNYSVRGDAAGELYKTVGRAFADKLIPQVVQGGLKNAAGKFEAVDLISHRENVRAEVEQGLKETLAHRGITVEGFQMTNVSFTRTFDDAVEAKVVAIQRAEQAKNQTLQIEEQAKQRIIAAEADAKAMKIKSDALSQNQNLVSYEAVQKWDGKLPEYMMGSAVPFISLPK